MASRNGRIKMRKLVGFALLMIGSSLYCVAGGLAPTPEIDLTSGGAALALLSGGLLVLRARRKK